jgi:hypothetical protein
VVINSSCQGRVKKEYSKLHRVGIKPKVIKIITINSIFGILAKLAVVWTAFFQRLIRIEIPNKI